MTLGAAFLPLCLLPAVGPGVFLPRQPQRGRRGVCKAKKQRLI